MLRPDFAARAVSKTLAQEAERISLPLSGGGTGFSAALNEVRRDIADFIASGSGSVVAPSLSAEGRAQYARLRGEATHIYTSGAGVEAELPVASRAQQHDFIDSIAPWAQLAADRLGVAPELVAAHAALESGWGQRPLRDEEGSSTHNLFGVKAGRDWRGESVRALTTEVEEGAAIKRTEEFRSYADDASAFRDYANLLLTNPRYGAAVSAGEDARAFARGLAQGNYATDPAYAQKLERVVEQVRKLGMPAPADAPARTDY
jgi:peptidoglycan hydrolase FlgJ